MTTAAKLKMFHFVIDKKDLLSRQMFTLFGCILLQTLMFDGGNFLSELDFGIIHLLSCLPHHRTTHYKPWFVVAC